jgi:hypothetical protein
MPGVVKKTKWGINPSARNQAAVISQEELRSAGQVLMFLI